MLTLYENLVNELKMIKLRGHHLLCLQFFEGRGYDKKFIENLKNILKRLNRGEKIKIVKGKDDICSACSYSSNNERCRLYKRIEEKDKIVLRIFNLNAGEEISWDKVIQRF